MKHEKQMKRVLGFPDGPEKRGRLQAIMDLNTDPYNFKNLNTARFATGITREGPNLGANTESYNDAEIMFWSAYLDTHEALDENAEKWTPY